MATYGSAAGVEGINAHLGAVYSSSTMPTSTQVATFLSDGYAALNTRLLLAGYTAPVTNTTVAGYAMLTRLNNLYAAACAEQATNLNLGGGEDTRAAALWARYEAEVAMLLAGDCTLLGFARGGSAPVRRRVRSLPLRHYDGYAINSDDVSSEYS